MRRPTLCAGLTFVLALSSSVVQAQTPAPTKPAAKPATASAKADPLKGLHRTYDKMRGIAWYQHPSSPRRPNSNAFYLYFGREDNGTFTPLRLLVRYFADDWLFVSRAWAKADGLSVEVPQVSNRFLGWERDNAAGDIWEWSDSAIILPKDIDAVRVIANAKSVTVRFEGRQYYNDRTLSAQQLKAMREMMAAYEAVTGKPVK